MGRQNSLRVDAVVVKATAGGFGFGSGAAGLREEGSGQGVQGELVRSPVGARRQRECLSSR